jgi:hypothetical protein
MKAVRLLPLLALFFTAVGFGGSDKAAAVADLKQRVAALEQPIRQGPDDFTTWGNVKFEAWRTSSLIRPLAAHVEGIRTVVQGGKIVRHVRFVARLEYAEKWELVGVAVTRGMLIGDTEAVDRASPEWAIMDSELGLSPRQP